MLFFAIKNKSKIILPARKNIRKNNKKSGSTIDETMQECFWRMQMMGLETRGGGPSCEETRGVFPKVEPMVAEKFSD